MGMGFSFIKNKNDMKKEIFEHLTSTVQSREAHIQTFLDLQEQAVRQLSQSEILKQFLLTTKKDENYRSRLQKTNQRLRNTVKGKRYIFKIFLLNKQGIIVSASDEKFLGKDKSEDIFFLRGKKGFFIKDACRCMDKEVPHLSFSCPVWDEEKTNCLGIIALIVLMKGIDEITTMQTALGETGEIYLVNKDGFMITPSRFRENTFLNLKVDSKGVKKCLEDIQDFGEEEHKHQAFIYKNYQAISVLGTHAHISRLSWGVIAEISEKEAMFPLHQQKTFFLIMGLIVLTSAWVCGFFISRLIVRPIHDLHKGMEKIGGGDLDYKVGTKAKDEIGQLSREFNKMTQNLKASTTSVHRLNQEVIQRQKAEQLLLEAKERVELLLKIVPSAIFTVDTQNIVTSFNNKATEIIGYQPKEIIGKSCKIFAIPCPEHGCPLLSKEVKKPIRRLEFLVKRKNGEIRTVIKNADIIKNEKGEFIGGVESFEDITHIKQAEEKIKIFSHSTESAMEGIAIVNLEARFTYINAAFVEMFGYSKETLLGKELTFIYSQGKDAQSKLQAAVEGTKKGKWKGELLARRKGGRCFPIEVNSSIVKNDSGQVIALVASYTDITQRKQAERELQLYSHSVESSITGITIANLKGRFIYINKAFREIFGYTKEELIDREISFIFPPDNISQSKVQEAIAKAKTREGFKGELLGRKKDGICFPIEVSASAVKDATGRIIALMVNHTDITQRKQAEEKMKEAVKVKSDFLSMISHELRTPLTAIKEGIGIVLDGSAGEINVDQEDFLATAKRNVDRLHRLINQVLDFSKLEARKADFRMEENDLNQAITEIVKMQQPVAKEKGLYLKMNLGDNFEKILFDRDKISQVLTNLTNNAFRHTDKGGITVSSRKDKDGKFIRVGIKDTGEGIKEEELGKLFEQFQQVGKKFRTPGSTGLGLVISKEIIGGHKGKIWAESRYNVGSEFIFTLPTIKEKRDKV